MAGAQGGVTSGTVVKLRGLPWQATEDDIAQFFSGLPIAPNGVRILLNFQGRPSGEAFVNFVAPEVVEQALLKHKHSLGHRYIEVFPATLAELERFAPRPPQRLPHSNDTGVIRLRGLPYTATMDDIVKFFDGTDVMKDIVGVHIVSGADGRPSGEAYVEVTNEDAVRRALSKHRSVMGSRYVEVFRSTKVELYNTIGPAGGAPHQQPPQPVAPQRHPQQQQPPNFFGQQATPFQYGNNVHEPTVLKMRGLPYSASDADIAEFFAGFVIAPNGIHILYNAQNRPTGEAMVEFVTADEAQRAISRHKTVMGTRYIELFKCTKIDLMNTIGNRSFSMQFLSGPSSSVIKMRGLPWSATPDDIAQFFSGLRITPNGIVIPLNYNSKPTGEAFVQFATSEDMDVALSKHRQMLGSRYIEIFRSSRAEMEKSIHL